MLMTFRAQIPRRHFLAQIDHCKRVWVQLRILTKHVAVPHNLWTAFRRGQLTNSLIPHNPRAPMNWSGHSVS